MSTSPCPYDAVLIRAMRGDLRSQALTEHLDTCPECQETSRTLRWMQALADVAGARQEPPDADRIWLRAQLEERQHEATRRLRRRWMVRGIVRVALATVGALIAVRAWFTLTPLLGGMRPLLPESAPAYLVAVAALFVPVLLYVVIRRLPLRMSPAGGWNMR